MSWSQTTSRQNTSRINHYSSIITLFSVCISITASSWITSSTSMKRTSRAIIQCATYTHIRENGGEMRGGWGNHFWTVHFIALLSPPPPGVRAPLYFLPPTITTVNAPMTDQFRLCQPINIYWILVWLCTDCLTFIIDIHLPTHAIIKCMSVWEFTKLAPLAILQRVQTQKKKNPHILFFF